MRFYNFLENIEVKETNINRFDVEINGVTSRSEEVEKDFVFVCLQGRKSDGHSFASIAKDRGAALLVTEKTTSDVIESGLPYVRVSNTRAALALMCAKLYGNPERSLDITAVTGTNGKTSFCQILSSIYSQSGFGVRTLGTLCGGLTTPDPEELYKELHSAFDQGETRVVMEASSHALALDKLYGMTFGNTVFTNLTPEHLDFHNSMDEYAETKAKLFKMGRNCIFNLDDPYAHIVSRGCLGRKYTYSLYDKNADFYADNLKLKGSEGLEFELVFPNNRLKIQSKLCGLFNAYNITAASSAALVEGIAPLDVQKGITALKNVKGRLERVETCAPFDLFIDYAHTPDALEKVLKCIRGFRQRGQRIILLFGCGGDRDRSKRAVMGSIASRLADIVIITADNSRSEDVSEIIKQIMKGIDKERPYKVIEDRSQAIEYAVNIANENDIILLAGKGHEEYEINKCGKIHFNEKEIAVRAIGKRFKGNDY